MKKLELIFPKSIMNEVSDLLTDAGLPGYTIFKSYKSFGKGHGESLEFGFSGSQDIFYLIAVCDAVTIDSVISKSSTKFKELGVLTFASSITIY